jgi:uncharacterized protein YtpQ (UPF0354 family)
LSIPSGSSDCLKAIAYIKKNDEKERDFLFKLGSKNEPIIKDLGNGLLVAYLVDKSGKFEYLQNRQLISEGISKEKMFEIGLLNLKKIATVNFRLKPMKSIYAVFVDGNFEASLLLISELWDKILKSYVKNKFVAAIPARDMLVFCDSESQDGLKELTALCKRVKNDGDKLLSDSLYIRENNFWKEYEN